MRAKAKEQGSFVFAFLSATFGTGIPSNMWKRLGRRRIVETALS
jgi:hypothetical protein